MAIYDAMCFYNQEVPFADVGQPNWSASGKPSLPKLPKLSSKCLKLPSNYSQNIHNYHGSDILTKSE
jgi:hypothetical protein